MSGEPVGYTNVGNLASVGSTSPNEQSEQVVSSCGGQIGGGKFVKGGPALWRKTLNKYRRENPKASLGQAMKRASPIYRRLKRRTSHKGAKLGKLRKNPVSRQEAIKLMKEYYLNYGTKKSMIKDMKRKTKDSRIVQPMGPRSWRFRFKRSGRHAKGLRRVSKHTGPGKYDMAGVDDGSAAAKALAKKLAKRKLKKSYLKRSSSRKSPRRS